MVYKKGDKILMATREQCRAMDGAFEESSGDFYKDNVYLCDGEFGQTYTV